MVLTPWRDHVGGASKHAHRGAERTADNAPIGQAARIAARRSGLRIGYRARHRAPVARCRRGRVAGRGLICGRHIAPSLITPPAS